MLPDASVNMGLNIALYVKRHIVAQSVERILAFCFALQVAKPWGFTPAEKDKVRDHENLRIFYKELFMTEIAENLDDLRQARNSCDYHDQVAGIDKLLKDAINDAQDIINRCEERY